MKTIFQNVSTPVNQNTGTFAVKGTSYQSALRAHTAQSISNTQIQSTQMADAASLAAAAAQNPTVSPNLSTGNSPPANAVVSASSPGTTSALTGVATSSTLFPLLLVAILAGAALVADREGWI